MHEHFAVNRCEGMALDEGGDTTKYSVVYASAFWCFPFAVSVSS